ncbi:PepSY-associated TM helix domain-containing protein [Selenomonas sp. oral taxon 149]|uniref:PepSY-associated TM helix domain-containing protein n=1 Tax=Selenomonas sp. oral taxon 149 TaxID=712535 RepID=UPI0001E07FCE|nr:PepSY-associated TM helix domain-containing protein [Selenomonas sp. oral taxon 149]EFM22531.1 PepSY domain protein [Selenomonas sp. oral taxon 149 str. 67H29BP]
MRRIYAVHQWVSLICALFLLLLTLTGLPLLFRGEINAWNTVNMPQSGEPMPMAKLWQALPEGEAAVRAAYPTKDILAVTPDDTDGTLYFRVVERGGAAGRSHMRMGGEQIMYDVRTHTAFDRKERIYRSEGVQTFMHTMHILHVRMGLEEGGRDFLALMCALSVVSIVTGIYLYLPMMKSMAFGTHRRRTGRVFWSDWHKITSIFAGTWATVMCVSGIVIVLYSVGMRDITARRILRRWSILPRRSSRRRRSVPQMHWHASRRAAPGEM